MNLFCMHPLVVQIWTELLPHTSKPNFFNQSVEVWMLDNLKDEGDSDQRGVPWHVVFSTALWIIRKRRNAWVFESGARVIENPLPVFTKSLANFGGLPPNSNPHI